MTDQEFFHWLNGYIEVSACTSIGEVQTAIIKDKLQSVFVKETKTIVGGGIVTAGAGTLGGFSTGGGTLGATQWGSTIVSNTVTPNYVVGT